LTGNPDLNIKDDENNSLTGMWGGWFVGASHLTDKAQLNWQGNAAYNNLTEAADSKSPWQFKWTATQSKFSDGKTATTYALGR